MEFLYRKLIGPIDPSRPTQSLSFMIAILKIIGLYPPDSPDKRVQRIYAAYATIFRWLFLHIFSVFQAIFFLQVSNIKEVADALFMFMTNISLMYKTEIYFRNRYRFKAVVQRFDSELFLPQNEEEQAKSMILGVFFHILNVSSPMFFISGTAITSLISRTQLVPSWYPIDNKPLLNFICIWLFQVIGLAGGAAINVVFDPAINTILLLTKCEIEKLGLMISKIGYLKGGNRNLSDHASNDPEMRQIDNEMTKYEKLYGKHYAELIKCIIHHRKLLEFVAEIEDMLKKPLYCQFIFSSLIICMTMVIMAEQNSLADIIPFMAYLMGMILQVYLYCYSVNEITVASRNLTDKIFAINFVDFDSKTNRVLLFFMMRSQNEIVMKAGNIIKVSLSLEKFTTLINSAYSYFTLLRTLQKK